MSAGATPAPRWREYAQILIRARLIVQAYYLIALYSLVGFVQRLQNNGVEHEFIVVEGVGHQKEQVGAGIGTPKLQQFFDGYLRGCQRP